MPRRRTSNMFSNYLKKKILGRLRGRVNDKNEMRPNQEDAQAQWERSRVRWRNAAPVGHLTWGKEINGDNFVSTMNQHGAFGSGKALLEIGPGYGRLLKSIIQSEAPFQTYLGVDLSNQNVAFLTETFSDERIAFQQGDIETRNFDQKFDVVFSSLTFKHLFPSFEKVLQNVARALNPRALVLFDLMEGSAQHFEPDGVTFLRHYTREEVSEILNRCGLRLAAWDEVEHTPEQKRLLVVATNN
jgi:SAM-dependent methyltransferase